MVQPNLQREGQVDGLHVHVDLQLELQLGVFDSDDWNVLGDDSLGRCTIVVGWDALDGGGERAYPLKGGGDGATITLSWKRTPAATA